MVSIWTQRPFQGGWLRNGACAGLWAILTIPAVFANSGDYWISSQHTDVYEHKTGRAAGKMPANSLFYGSYDKASNAILFTKNSKVYRVYRKQAVSFSELEGIRQQVKQLQQAAINASAEAARYEQLMAIEAPRITHGRSTVQGTVSTFQTNGGFQNYNVSGYGNHSSRSVGANFQAYRVQAIQYMNLAAKYQSQAEALKERYGVPVGAMMEFRRQKEAVDH